MTQKYSEDEIETLEKAHVALSVEGWKFARTISRLLGRMDASEASRYAGQLRYFQERIDATLAETGFRIVNLEGLPYDAGMAVTVLNPEYSAGENAVVEQMLEPVVMGRDGMVRVGSVMLGRAGA